MHTALQDFNRKYLQVHIPKENLFWSTYMGLEKDASLLKEAETAFIAYISSPERLPEVRQAMRELETAGGLSQGEF